ncbi:hypothetical protein HMPREF0262_02482, partial [Clostridium sp. ATCC 29733]
RSRGTGPDFRLATSPQLRGRREGLSALPPAPTQPSPPPSEERRPFFHSFYPASRSSCRPAAHLPHARQRRLL